MATEPQNLILQTENLKFRYDPEARAYALDGVTMGVRRGEFVAVLGANGCGKSTLAKHFNAILLPESGTVTVEGMSTADESRLYDIRQTVGMVFQNPDNQIVATVVEEDVAFALENLGVPPAQIRTRIDEAMKMADIYKHRGKAPHKLSGGQKQRVAIAGVIAMRPDCLILDEATAMLDPRGREQVMSTIGHLNRDFGITVVAITHYMEEAARADRVLVMSEGRGGHPQAGVQPGGSGARAASGCAPGRRAAGRAGQGRRAHAGGHYFRGRVRQSPLRAAEVRGWRAWQV